MSEIKDSGSRREFETGAVRDIAEGKGRCDLLPLAEVAVFLGDAVLCEIESYRQTGDVFNLYNAMHLFCGMRFKSEADAVLELAVHFEEGAKKYGEYNWQKGLPPSSYIDSGVRHYLKWKAGWEDERHDRAFLWNMICLIWTERHFEEPKTSKTCLEDFMEKHPEYSSLRVIEEKCVKAHYPVGDVCIEMQRDCEKCWRLPVPDTPCTKKSDED